MKLVPWQTPGNVHRSAHYLNAAGLAESTMQIIEVNEYHSLALLKVHDDFDINAQINSRPIELKEFYANVMKGLI